MDDRAKAQQDLTEYRLITADRDARVRRALAAGITKMEIHELSGIGRATIDRLLTKENVMTTTTQLHGFGSYTLKAEPKDAVLDYLGDFSGDFDVDGLTDAYRDAINAALSDTGIVLHGSDFYSNYPAPDDSHELIKDAIASVDLGELAPQYDRS